jgi:hypothetical protein
MGDLFCGADPLVRAGRPRPAFLSKHRALATIDKPARGPAADEGVRPTIYTGARYRENEVALGYLSAAGASPRPQGYFPMLFSKFAEA